MKTETYPGGISVESTGDGNTYFTPPKSFIDLFENGEDLKLPGHVHIINHIINQVGELDQNEAISLRKLQEELERSGIPGAGPVKDDIPGFGAPIGDEYREQLRGNAGIQ